MMMKTGYNIPFFVVMSPGFKPRCVTGGFLTSAEALQAADNLRHVQNYEDDPNIPWDAWARCLDDQQQISGTPLSVSLSRKKKSRRL
jgi:hypothetical protein